MRRFFAEFWTGGMDALAVHREQMEDLAVPDSVSDAHDEYMAALDTLIDREDDYVAQAETTSGAELLTTFWDSTPELDAMTETCKTLVDEAATHGLTITSPICDE